jgi:hypothetical protein
MNDLLPNLLAPDRLNELGPAEPNVAMRADLEALPHKLVVKDRDFAQACYAGLWLLHDFIDESHNISQELDTIEGSAWHGILHRREPDYWNAKYWFRRVPAHPIFADLRESAAALTLEAKTPAGSEYLLTQKSWDSAAFVDLCEKAARGPDALTMLCKRIQRREWDLLFAYCCERAFIH